MKNAVLVVDENRLDRVIDPVAFADIETRIIHIDGKVEDDLLLETFVRGDLFVEIRLPPERGFRSMSRVYF